MYSAFVLIPQYVAAPVTTGYGYGASVTQAGLYLLPSTIALMICSPLGARLGQAAGPKVPLVIGCAITTLSFVVLAASSASWQIYLASGLMGIGVGFAFAASANLIVQAVRPDQTGVASGMNTIVRTIGGAIGAEVAATILAANTLASGWPDKHGYTVTFVICGVAMGVGVLAALAVPGRRHAVAPAPVPAVD
jgi:MFS family permease